QSLFAALLFWPIGSAGAQAPAQPAVSPAQIDRIVGPWELSNPAGDRKCDVTFKPERNGSGFGLAFGPG
ncbi:hypothetical protein, partial [Streptococcus pneumoniae]|uniref:hypothetical protein n=1 Tax=Streptococcus pneumoniae TaxID=1313 RepID=UPI0013DB6325